MTPRNPIMDAEAQHDELAEALENFRDHIIRHVCVWDDGANGSHHHPIWAQIAEALAKLERQP